MNSGWWESLTSLNKFFYSAATFFSVFFVWQLIAALIGLSSDDASMDTDADADAGGMDHDFDHDFDHGSTGSDTSDSMMAFKLLSVRSVIAFFTLFTWGSALYMNNGMGDTKAMAISILWGLVGMFSVAGIFAFFKKMTSVGNLDLSTCVGTEGTVYLDIPADGFGEVRVTVSGVVKTVKARSVDNKPIQSNTLIRVTRRMDQNSVEVEKIANGDKE